ncbi:MAG: hypothetical protein Harvfovirus1_34 [Harvfovirus sp.]|uniref:VWFA domain-containing protein n=1 Tax=Harvfovirus sp. TaxID=2487768 RepID=A0A3G5A4K9_9VIRU|nr:MAG: hypothetical protein Harvfovirus1_34 [Harvfovirus sp.]
MTRLKLFPAFNGYVGKLITGEDLKHVFGKKCFVETIVILDISGSMGANVEKIIREVLPKTFLKIGYAPSDKITLITFHDNATTYTTPIATLSKSTITAGNRTYMSDAIKNLKEYLARNHCNKHVRLLAISDGALNDQDATVTASCALAGELKGYCINSQAIRLFTSESQPDTRGLSSVLQLNTICQSKLIDIKTYENIDYIIGDLFLNDNLDRSILLTSENEIFMEAPWRAPTSKIMINNTDNVIWFKDLPKNIMINNVPHKLEIEICSQMTFDNFSVVMADKIDYYMTRLKVLKIVNTEAAIAEIGEIVGYFSSLEKTFVQDGVLDTSLGARGTYYKNLVNKKKKSVMYKMQTIANDEKVAKLNSAQQADYLRTMDVSKNSKALARRALTNDIDFDSVVRKEVRDMYSNLDLLKDISDASHTQSFYSRETTLGGIRATCDLVKEGILDDMNATDILTMINIVGVPCFAVIGNYPDPMTWRIDNIYVSCYISLSDILMAGLVSSGKALKAVGTDKEINNTVPFFDDDRIHLFLKKYAPSILEYSASIGMRRMIMHVPMTYSYTVCAGVWKMVHELNTVKSAINIGVFSKLIASYSVAVGGYFDHVLAYIVDQDEKLSYYIGNNGVTNMISVIMRLVAQGNVKNMTRIVRALYSYEINQAVKRRYKYMDHGEGAMAKDLMELVCIDFEKNKTGTKPLLVEEDLNPEFCDKYERNEELFLEIMKGCWYVNYLTLLPQLLSAGNIKEIAPMDDETVCKALAIDYDLSTYQFFTIVQSMLWNNKGDRVDSDNSKMLIAELGGDFAVGDGIVREYVRKQYQSKYTSDLMYKIKGEKELLSDMLVQEMLDAISVKKFNELFVSGIKGGASQHKIVNKGSLGYNKLKCGLLDREMLVKKRLGKLKVLLLGRSEKDEIIWNNGNTLAVELKEFKEMFVAGGGEAAWKGLYDEYAKRNIHIYRVGDDDNDIPNRHSHCNAKPSYWAFGFSTIEAFARSLTSEQWEEYKLAHPNCCGVSKLNF